MLSKLIFIITILLGLISLILLIVSPPIGIIGLILCALLVIANRNRQKSKLETQRHDELIQAMKDK